MSEIAELPGMPEKRGRRLGSLSNIKAALADVYRQQEDGCNSLDAGDAPP